MGMLTEFKEFAMRGNVVDLAIGVVIGAAFGKIVTSLVDQIVMPPIGWLIGGVDFTALKIALPENPTNPGAEPVFIEYGAFLNTIIQFVIVSFVIFMVVKGINKLRRQQAAEPDATPEAPTPTEALLTEIRDELRARK